MPTEPEVIEAEAEDVTDNLPAVRQPAAVNLFGDATAADMVARATEAAHALAAVIEDRKVYKVISGKKHVLVEGWTLLGSMLGVFPVVEWTRKTEDGWEARVVARTLSGAEVGAAEAMCSKSEARWKKADDYAIRSMAQTRATSKALRLPLGFVMTLAGYEATPESEMDAAPAPSGGEPGAAPTAAVENRPGTVLPPSFPAGKDLLERIGVALKHANPDVDWLACWDQAISHVYHGMKRSELMDAQLREAITRLACVADRLSEGGDFPPTDAQPVAAAFAQYFEGVVVDVPYHEPADAPIAASVEPDDSIEF